MPPHPGMFVKSSIMKKYKFDIRYKIIADYEFILRYIKDGYGFTFIDMPVVYFSNNGCSSNSNKLKSDYELLTSEYDLKLDKYFNHIIDSNDTTFQLLKNNIRTLIEMIGCMPLIKMLLGWERHRCFWEKCRWCRHE